MLTVFAPDALAEADARAVTVGDSDEIADVDITIPTRLLHSVGGLVTQGGVAITGASVTIERAGERGNWSGSVGADGQYRFDLLPPGDYAIEAEYPPAGTQSRAAHVKRRIEVQVGPNDVPDANIDLPSAAGGQRTGAR